LRVPVRASPDHPRANEHEAEEGEGHPGASAPA
jgi:hypothetical protein